MKNNIKKYFFQVKKYIFSQLVCDTISMVALASIPYLQKELFDSFSEMSFNYLICWVGTYLLFIGVFNLFSYFSDFFTFKGIVKFEFALKRDYFASVIKMEDEEFSKNQSAEYLSMDNNDITEIGDDYLQTSIDLVRNIIGVLIYGYLMIRCVHSFFIVVVMILCVALIVISDVAGQRLGEKLNAFLEKLKEYNSLYLDLLQGKQLVNKYTLERFLFVHQNKLKENAELRFRYGKRKSQNIALYQFIVNLIEFITIAACGIMAINKKMTVGTCVVTLSYVSCFIGPIQGITDDIHNRKAVLPLIDKVSRYMNRSSRIDDPIAFPQGDIVVSQMSVKRGDCNICDLTYTFEKGKKYCIMGNSGTGKTTLLDVLSSKIAPETGCITIGGCSNKECSSHFFYANQQVHIFNTGYSENVSVFGSYLIDDEIDATLRYILGDERYNLLTHCSNCLQLSGGEKQLVSFARCLFSKRDYIFLDEPFSAVDIGTRQKLLDYICEQKKTVIMVSHDASDSKFFDVVLQLQNGKLIERVND